MVTDIVVTTPMRSRRSARREAEECIEHGGGTYFRRFSKRPAKLKVGSRIFYVENGYIRGFAEVFKIRYQQAQRCGTTGRIWAEGWYAYMSARSWYWIDPIPMEGFQGFRYFDRRVQIAGGWKDPMPEVTA